MLRVRNFYPISSAAFAFALTFALTLTLTSGCFTGDAAQGLPCEGEVECGPALVCVKGLCAPQGSEPCGNGLLNTDEECDEGEANGPGSSCTAVCKINICGDGIVGSSERCDSDDRSLCTEDCEAIAFADDMQDGINGWTHEVSDYPEPACKGDHCFEDDWQRKPAILALDGHPDELIGSTFAWHSGNLSNVRGGASSRLISPEIDLREAEAPISLSFYHYYHFKTIGGIDKKSDGSVVEISVDGGEWQEYELADYIDTISLGAANCSNEMVTPNPLRGRAAFTGTVNSWLRVQGTLDEFAGHTIRLGFRIASDCASDLNPYGMGDSDAVVEWFVDDVVVLDERSK